MFWLGQTSKEPQATSFVFDHRHAECSSNKSSIFDNCTRVNEYEVAMSVAIAMHFLQQAQTKQVSYDQGSITILTPYLGQLREIKARLQAQGLRAVK